MDILTGKPWAQAPWELVTAPISANAFRVAMAIQLHRRPNGTAPFPSQRTLAKMCGISLPTCERAIRELKEGGYLVAKARHKAGGQHTTSAYTLKVPSITGEGAPSITDEGPTPITGEGAEAEESEAETAPSKKERVRDPIWDTLTDLFGEATTHGSKSLRGKLVKSLKEAGATPEEIKSRAQRYPRVMPAGTLLTETALEKHWPILAPVSVKTPPCKECGTGGGLHQADCPLIVGLTG